MGKYDDIINLPHHTSPKRPRMSMIDRAAQFSPFAALTGYDAAIKETGRLTDRRIELSEEERIILDRKQQYLMGFLSEQPDVSVTYFVPDKRKDGGAYVTVTASLKKVDEHLRLMIMSDGTRIPLDEVVDIDGKLFSALDQE